MKNGTKIALLTLASMAWLCPGAALAQGPLQGPQLPDRGPGLAAPSMDTVSPLAQAEFSHEAVVKNERMDTFFRAWDTASEERRDAAADVLASLRSSGAPSEWWPDPGSIEVATRVLGGESAELLLAENEAAILAVQAASLDLRVQPGLFESRATGRGQSLVVRVAPLFELREALAVHLRLIWIGPDGQEQIARDEVVGKSAFKAPGFDMYIRAPLSADACWTLVAELRPTADASLEQLQEEAGGPKQQSALFLRPIRSYGVSVPALRKVDQVTSLLMDQANGGLPPDESSLQGQLAARRVSRIGAAMQGLTSEGLRLSPLAGFSFTGFWEQSCAGQIPTPQIAQRTERVFLRSSTTTDAFGAVESGIVMQAWSQLGTVLDVAQSAGGLEPVIGRSCSNLKGLVDSPKETILVLRGDALMSSQLEAMRHGLRGFDKLVIVANSWRPTPLMPDVPTLFLTPNKASADLAGQADHVTAKVLSRSVFLSELDVPAQVADWLGISANPDGSK